MMDCRCKNYEPADDPVDYATWLRRFLDKQMSRPAPGQPCPACGQPVPDPIPPAPRKDAVQENPPFKEGDWVTRDGQVAYKVLRVWNTEYGWKFCSTISCLSFTCSEWTLLRPAPLPGATPASRELPPLPGAVKEWVQTVLNNRGIDWGAFQIAAARFLRDLYPHEFGVR